MQKIPLNIRIPSPLSPANIHQGQRPLGGQSLLYKTYDDYFNMEEDASPLMTPSLLSASSTLLSPLYIQTSKHNLPVTPDTEFNKFFFVLSASSPSDIVTCTPISPVKKGDIPDALVHLLPRRSNSLLDVVSVVNVSGSLKLPEPRKNSAPNLRQEQVSHHEHDASTKTVTPGKVRPLPPIPVLLRDNNAAVPMTRAFTEPAKMPASSHVEVTSVPSTPNQPVSLTHTRVLTPLRRSDLSRPISDPRSNKTHSQSVPLPHFASALKFRVRKGGRTDVVIPPSRVKQVKHGRGRTLPFPAPIQSAFAPPSIPGSERTPYGYF